MGLRLQRRVRLFPGCHLNLSASGLGVSLGGRGAHIGITARGQRYVSAGIPGTGVSWREYERKPARAVHSGCDLCVPGDAHVPAVLLVVALIVAAIVVLAAVSRG